MHPKAIMILNFIILFGAVLLAGKSIALLAYGHEDRAAKGFLFAALFLYFVGTDKDDQ